MRIISTRGLRRKLRLQERFTENLYGRGFDLTPRSDLTTPRSLLQAMLETHRVDTVIDVGANAGQFGQLVRSTGYTGRIVSFEPTERAYEALTANAEGDAHWTCFKLALGRASGQAVMQRPADSLLSSFLKPSDFGKARFACIENTVSEQVEMKALDEIAPQLPLGQRILLKLDTQGHDLEVYAGARSLIPRVCCLTSEISFIPVYEGMPTYHEALQVYMQDGFVPAGFHSVCRNPDLSSVEMDCFLVKRLPDS